MPGTWVWSSREPSGWNWRRTTSTVAAACDATVHVAASGASGTAIFTPAKGKRVPTPTTRVTVSVGANTHAYIVAHARPPRPCRGGVVAGGCNKQKAGSPQGVHIAWRAVDHRQ
jgi:hypothetical protein